MVLSAVVTGACGPGRAPAAPTVAPLVTAATAPFSLTSSAFAPGAPIPVKHSCDGQDVSPPLEWGDPPEGTQSLALLVDDPDADGYVHWILYNLPVEARGLPEAVPGIRELSDGSRQGQNGWGEAGYGGPCPPGIQAHRYNFTLYALDTMPELAPGAQKSQLLEALKGHILAQAELAGTYARQQ
jgi:hypothetical protein